MDIPNRLQAELMIDEAEKLNPGPWVAHCYAAAESARHIAEKCCGMDSEAAYVMGLLHDIGRREGFTHILHTIDGYNFLSSQGYADAARICLTHSFPEPDVNAFYGAVDCTAEQFDFLKNYIANIEYTDYDRLIQLCDAISLPKGPVLMEKRLVDIAVRHGLPDFTLKKWRAYFELKNYFDDKAGCNIYTVLPNIIENTFN